MIFALPDMAPPGPVAPATILPPQAEGAVDFAGLLDSLSDAAPSVRAPSALPTSAHAVPVAPQPGGTVLPVAVAELPPVSAPLPQDPVEAQPAAQAVAAPPPPTEMEAEDSKPHDPALHPSGEEEKVEAPDPAADVAPPPPPPPVIALLAGQPPALLPAPAPAPRGPVAARGIAPATTMPAPGAPAAAPVLPFASPGVPAAPVKDAAPSPLEPETQALHGDPGAPSAPAPAAAPAAHTPQLSAPASPATLAEPRIAPQQESAIAQVGEIREALRAARPEMTLRHAEFGFVNLRVEAAGAPDSWRAVLASRDPGFVPAVQAALADRAVAAPSDSAASNSGTYQGGASDQRYGSSHSSGQGSSSPYLEQFPKRDEGGERHQRQRSPQGEERRGDDGDAAPANTRRGMFA